MIPVGTVLENKDENSEDEFYTVTSSCSGAPDWVLLGEYSVYSYPEEKKVSKTKVSCKSKTAVTVKNKSDVEKVRSFLSSQNVADLEGVTDNFNLIFKQLNSSEKGRIAETVFKLAIYLKIELPDIPQFPLTLFERNQKCFKISDIGFGVKSGGCDIMAVAEKFVLAGTAKIKHVNTSKKTKWGEIEWQNVFVEAGLLSKYKDHDQVFLALVSDKRDLDNSIPSYIKEKFSAKNRIVVDISDVAELWGQVLSVFEKHGWDNLSVEEGVRDRITLKLRPHQKECVEHCLSRLFEMKKREGYLIADKPRAGKTIMFAEIVRNLWEEKLAV